MRQTAAQRRNDRMDRIFENAKIAGHALLRQRIEEAQKAISESRYDDAQKALVLALHIPLVTAP